MLCIGNDIVDLTGPGSMGKSRDRRFRARVFTAAEEERIDSAASPDTSLWMLWAAKEAAFKAAGKIKPGIGFIPREYAVAPSRCEGLPPVFLKSAGGEEASVQEHGVILTPVGSMTAIFTISPRRVHCLAVGDNGYGGGIAALDKTVQAREEKRTAPFDPSAAVRRAAIHHLASVLRTSPYYVDIRRAKTSYGYGGPPRVFLDGRQTDIDISLSHDGAYIAFAVTLKPPENFY